MTLIRIGIALAAVGVLLCLWLLVKVAWYSFVLFMLVAQPALLLAGVIFLVVAAKELREKGVL
jgi:hypothetical protein